MLGRRDIHHGLAVALEAARGQGQLPESTDIEEVARVLSAVVADALLGWAQGGGRRLRPLLRSRAAVVWLAQRDRWWLWTWALPRRARCSTATHPEALGTQASAGADAKGNPAAVGPR